MDMPFKPSGTLTRPLVLLLTLLTGYTGLVYEVTWHRYLANLLGSQAKASAIILAVFLGGLCIGYFLFGKFSKKQSSATLLKLTGWAEIGIGIWCTLFPKLYELIWQGLLSTEALKSGGLFVDVGLSVALIGVPTILMGSTLPLLTQALSRSIQDATSLHAKIYALNTGGAFFGCLTAGFLLLPSLGLPLTLLTTAPINIVAGLIFLLLGSQNDPQEQEEEAPPATLGSISLRSAMLLSFCAGFYALTLQVVLIRLVGLSVGASEYAFCLIVSLYIYMLARGSWKLSNQEANERSLLYNQYILFISSVIVYVTVSYWPYAAHVVRSLFTPEAPSFYLYHLAIFVALGLLLLIPLSHMGKTMPLIFACVDNKAEKLGDSVGNLYGLNTLGCMLGAFGGGYLLLSYLDLDTIFRICLALIAISCYLSSPLKQSRTTATIVTGVFFLASFSLPQWEKQYLGKGTFRKREARPYSYQGPKAFYRPSQGQKVIQYRDGPNTTVAVVEFKQPGTNAIARSLYVNGKSDGATAGPDLLTTKLLAHLPALFETGNSQNAAIIGFGTGMTAQALLTHKKFQAIDLIEISPIVQQFAPAFDFANGALSQEDRLKWHIEDAYRYLSHEKKKFDIIISEPSNPWVAGVERLYTQDFYKLVSKKLTKSGVYAQWFHLYAVSPKTFSLVLKTFSSVFPSIRIFETRNDLIILGSLSPLESIGAAGLQEKIAQAEVAQDLSTLGIHNVEDLLAFEFPAHLDTAKQSPIHTLEFPRLAFQAGKDFFFGGKAPIQEYLSETVRLPLLEEAERQNLYQTLLPNAPSEKMDRYLFQLAKRRCPGDPSHYFLTWRDAPTLCKPVLVALAQRGKMPRPKDLKDDDDLLEQAPYSLFDDSL